MLMMLTLFAMFLVLVVLAIQYESVTDPLVMLVSIPLALVAVGLLLCATATPMSAPVERLCLRPPDRRAARR